MTLKNWGGSNHDIAAGQRRPNPFILAPPRFENMSDFERSTNQVWLYDVYESHCPEIEDKESSDVPFFLAAKTKVPAAGWENTQVWYSRMAVGKTPLENCVKNAGLEVGMDEIFKHVDIPAGLKQSDCRLVNSSTRVTSLSNLQREGKLSICLVIDCLEMAYIRGS